MTPIRFLQLDVFTRFAGGGNPLGVVLGAESWTDARMQRFARWANLVETTFVLPPSRSSASYRLRIFTPYKEIPFAGHPTIGSAHAVLETAFAEAQSGRLVQECLAGLLPIQVEGDGPARELFVAAPASKVLIDGAPARARLATVLSHLDLGPLGCAFVEGGRRWWLAEIADEAALRAWSPNHGAIGELARATDSLGLCVFARSQTEPAALAVRAFPAGVGIVEDPASGAANGLIAAFIAEREPNGPLASGYRVSQGREIGHDAEIGIRFGGDGSVQVGGQTQTVIDGWLRWPE
ncbi:PhzF family phenazine biosynthesis protein [Ahniella affigens]|uniref:PhzF family phenazine biosynthesis protein n=1 Tax=Ahniella affigens TaxID=2021234 RepID=A0A2P1PYQ9_9GAMM|nr:PhzF family phenazine biosynthesis protein [Ahniella affigens]AVP99975.1 PhzF family phenazine biosynthesis protein [Ahniella affigens]